MSRKEPVLPRLKPLPTAAVRAGHERRKGRTVPEEVRQKISETLKARGLPEEHKEKIRAARRARPPRTNESILAECRALQQQKWLKQHKERNRQLKIDMAIARQMRNLELYRDLKHSLGYFKRRTIFHEKVSDGYSWSERKVVWSCKGRFAREEFDRLLKAEQIAYDRANGLAAESEGE